MQAYLDRIAAVNPRHNAIVSLRDGDVLLREADRCDLELVRHDADHAPLPFLFGMPQAIKDIVADRGLRTTFGSPLLSDFVPTEDALMVQRMKAAGCIVIGKTNTPEFGLGSHTFNEVFGATRNAYDPADRPAAAAAARRSRSRSDCCRSPTAATRWEACATRRPGTTCSASGRARAACRAAPAQDVWVTHFGTEGPMARTVRDLALLLDVQAGYDARAPLSLAREASFAIRLDDDAVAPTMKRPRIGWLGDLGGHLAFDDGILDVCAGGLNRLASIGCAVEPMALGFAPRAPLGCLGHLALVAASHGRIAPFLNEAREPRLDQAGGAVGARPRRAAHRPADHGGERRAQPRSTSTC